MQQRWRRRAAPRPLWRRSVQLSRSEGRTNREKKRTSVRRQSRRARKNAVNHISSVPSWQPDHIDQLKTGQPALGVFGYRSLTVAAQPLGEIGAVPAPPAGVKTARFEPAQVRNSTLSSAAITTI
jgi:hypothetical protein